MLMDSATLSLRALLEGNVLTTLRTPAFSAVATDYLAPKETTKLVVFGTGPQALAHSAAFAEIRSFTELVVRGRTLRASSPRDPTSHSSASSIPRSRVAPRWSWRTGPPPCVKPGT
ncbi:hypothetical protein GCM10009859_04150 [Kocuria salsicia]